MSEGAAWFLILVCGAATLNCAVQIWTGHQYGVMQGWGRRRRKPLRRGEPIFKRELILAWTCLVVFLAIDTYLLPGIVRALNP